VAAGGVSWLNSGEATSDAETTATETPATSATPAETNTKEAGKPGELPKVETINLCSTCHARTFCTDCHGVPLPHPSNWKNIHGAFGKANPLVCQKCHGYQVDFCNTCHHSTAFDWQYDPTTPWIKQHPLAVRAVGVTPCLKCHDPTFCPKCHTGGPAAVGLKQ
jgi:hypothetical protein